METNLFDRQGAQSQQEYQEEHGEMNRAMGRSSCFKVSWFSSPGPHITTHRLVSMAQKIILCYTIPTIHRIPMIRIPEISNWQALQFV